ncbi:MAG: hypothetical protein KAR57_07535 [Bacteroidales bacterium]|nr:hypothetical protein [Bacteroidales bacterium]
MESTDIIKYIEAPGLLVNADTNHFKELIKENPFFQIAHILLLKSLKDQKSEEFQKQLSESSVFITDRDQLFKFLNTEYKPEKKAEENKPKKTEFIEREKTEIPEEKNSKQPELLKNKNVKRKINDSIEGMGENISETISSQLEFSVIKEDDKLEYSSEIYFMEEERNGKNQIITIDADPDDIKKLRKKKRDILQIDEVKIPKPEKKLVEKQKNEDAFELIESESVEKAESKEKAKSIEHFDINSYHDVDAGTSEDDLISKFVKKNPRIEPKEIKEEIEDISHESVIENLDLLSETLVKVYIKQGLFEKAIQSYEKLSLKYPEKNTYFASQIKILEDKINKQ